MIGTVTLVGAGPGDPGLMTLAGREALASAGVVAYDRLVSAAILDMVPQTARRIAVSQRGDEGTVSQGAIAALMAECALAGSNVARLKGGDPFLFGRGGEELEVLAARGVPFRVVPGVSAAFGVPAYGGIPMTYGDLSGSVHIITGSPRTGRALTLNYAALAQVGGTLVFLMAAERLREICTGLMAAGMPPGTPATMIEQGTTPAQRQIGADLGTLAHAAEATHMGDPAVILVGQVCTLAERLGWYGK